MNQPDGGNCPTCMKPRTAKDGDGFITRFVDTCQCSLVSTDQSDTQKVVLCRRCGRRIGTGSPGSFTQWLFSEHSCQCTLKDPLEIENTQTEDTIAPYSPATASLELSETEFPVERYIPVALRGAGMTGKVYLCQDKKMETRVAIKVLHAVDSASLISFHREAKLVSTLKHSSIINVLDFGIMGQSKPYMVMPYRPGCTLSRLLSERGRVDPRTALIIVQKICAPLAYAHSKGVFHRDIKPDNILVSEYETSSRGLDIQVFDFGIALAELSTEESRMFQGQTVVGTPPYMSPDQVLGRKFDARSDIYSLGCVLYQMIAGHPPFVGDSVFELLEKHATAELPPLPTLAGDELVDEVNVILAKCLAKEPADRYQTMDELGLAIDQALNISDYSESAIGLSRLDIPDVRPVSPIKSAESHRVFLLVTSLLLALFSVALLYWVMGRWGLAQTSRIKDMTKDNLVGRENSKKEAKDRSDKIEDLLKEASKLRREKQFKKAISVLRKVEELCIPGSQAAVAVQFPLAQCFADEGDEQQAISRSRAVLEFYYVDPPSPAQERRVTLWVASYLSDLGMVKETQVYYERSVPLRKKELSALG
ncbi:MAG: serine/threonine protein kinase, partial [Cyanobacteria bacterium]|nr:serine/threonine protein kinase [Cyanobacteriota bacterium]